MEEQMEELKIVPERKEVIEEELIKRDEDEKNIYKRKVRIDFVGREG